MQELAQGFPQIPSPGVRGQTKLIEKVDLRSATCLLLLLLLAAVAVAVAVVVAAVVAAAVAVAA